MRGLVGAIYFLCAIAVILAMTGCAPHLVAQSAAPPGRSARLDEVRGFWGNVKSYRIELSAGVALAVNCHQAGPCEQVNVTSDDPRIAEVRAASLGTLERNGLENQATSTGVVVVGKGSGKTMLHLRTKRGKREIAVTIVPPPIPR